MSVAGAQAVVPGNAPVRAVPPKWRVLRLSESVQAGVWAHNTTYVRVLASAQDDAGWITLTLQNPTPAATYPADHAYLAWVVKDAYGRTTLPGPGGGALSGVVQFFLERDTTGWPGGHSETVALGICDNDGESDAGSANLLAGGIRTPSAASTCTVIGGNATSASASTGVATHRLVMTLNGTPTQNAALVVGALDDDATYIDGQFASSTPPLPAVGTRAVWLGAGCASTGASGPYTVRFRAFYRVLPAPDLP